MRVVSETDIVELTLIIEGGIMNLRNILVVALCLVSITLGGAQSAFTQADNSSRFDYALVFDVSGSMNQALVANDVTTKLQHVKRVAGEFARQINTDIDVRVYVYTFDAGLQTTTEFDVNSAEVRGHLVDYIGDLEAHGKNTYIYRSLDTICKVHMDQMHPILILLYTDGVDNSGDDLHFVINSLNELQQDRYACVYYTTLGFNALTNEEKNKLEQDATELRERANVKLIRPEQAPPSITIIRPMHKWLDFGNVQLNPRPSRVIHLYSDNSDMFPPELTVRINTKFPVIANGMVVPTIEHGIIERDALLTGEHDLYVSRELTLSTDNIDDADVDGSFEGTIRLVSSDPNVFIAPDTIHAVFRYEAPRLVNVYLKDGYEFDAGELKPHTDGMLRTVPYQIGFEFNPAARDRQDALLLRVLSADPKGTDPPAWLKVFLNGQQGRTLTVDADVEEVDITFSSTTEAPEGSVELLVVVTSTEADIRDLAADADALTTKELTGHVSVSVEGKPLPQWLVYLLWIGGVLLVLVLLLIAYGVFTGSSPWEILGGLFEKDTFPSATLTLREPKSDPEDDLDLIGLREILIGSGGKFACNASTGSVRLLPRKQGGKCKIEATVVSGEVKLKAQGEKAAFEFTRSFIADSDQLIIGEYIVEFLCYSVDR